MRYKQFWNERKILFLSLHLMLLALTFSGWLTGNKPIVCKYQGEWYFPVLISVTNQKSNLSSDLQSIGQMDFRKLNYDFSIWPLFDNHPTKLQSSEAWQVPGSVGSDGTYYILGTYELGRDLFSACIVGLNRSLWLSLIAMLIAAFTGIVIGSASVYQSQRLPRISIWSVILLLLSCLITGLLIFLLIEMRSVEKIHLILFVILLISMSLAFVFYNRKPMYLFSLDRISLAYVEVMKSIPALLFLLILVQIFIKPGTMALALIIAFLYTPVLIKYSRTYTFKIIAEPFLDALAVSGAGPARIFLKHILPKVTLDMMPLMAFGLAHIIILESSLSFLGLGLPLEAISLGNIMNSARGNPTAWWAILFPGLIVFWIVFSLNSLGEWLAKRKEVLWVQEIAPHS